MRDNAPRAGLGWVGWPFLHCRDAAMRREGGTWRLAPQASEPGAPQLPPAPARPPHLRAVRHPQQRAQLLRLAGAAAAAGGQPGPHIVVAVGEPQKGGDVSRVLGRRRRAGGAPRVHVCGRPASGEAKGFSAAASLLAWPPARAQPPSKLPGFAWPLGNHGGCPPPHLCRPLASPKRLPAS